MRTIRAFFLIATSMSVIATAQAMPGAGSPQRPVDETPVTASLENKGSKSSDEHELDCRKKCDEEAKGLYEQCMSDKDFNVEEALLALGWGSPSEQGSDLCTRYVEQCGRMVGICYERAVGGKKRRKFGIIMKTKCHPNIEVGVDEAGAHSAEYRPIVCSVLLNEETGKYEVVCNPRYPNDPDRVSKCNTCAVVQEAAQAKCRRDCLGGEKEAQTELCAHIEGKLEAQE